MPAFQYNPTGQLISPLIQAAAAAGQGSAPDNTMNVLNYNARLAAASANNLMEAQKLQMAHQQVMAQLAARQNTATSAAGANGSVIGSSIQQAREQRLEQAQQDQQNRQQQTDQHRQDTQGDAVKAKWNFAHSLIGQNLAPDEQTRMRAFIADPRSTVSDLQREWLNIQSQRQRTTEAADRTQQRQQTRQLSAKRHALDIAGRSLTDQGLPIPGTSEEVAPTLADPSLLPADKTTLTNYGKMLKEYEDSLNGDAQDTGPTPANTAGASATNGPVRVNSPQEALALPPGTAFMTPDGRLKVRP